MALDANKLSNLFDQSSAEQERERLAEAAASDPTLREIFALVSDKFTTNSSFLINPIDRVVRSSLTIFALKAPNTTVPSTTAPHVNITENVNGTFCINGNGTETTYNERTAEDVIKALGGFHGRHKDVSKEILKSSGPV